MKYIEENENVTREYKVIIDDEALSKIVDELNEKCCRAVKTSINVTAYDEEEAKEKIDRIKKGGIIILKKTEVPEYNKGSFKGNKPLYLFECEYFIKQNPYLSYLLTTALRSYRSTVGFNNGNDNTIKLLIEYANNDELKTYQERMAENGITKELYDEYENNKDFDFALLNELYEKAFGCFKLLLVSEKTDYKNVDVRDRVYTLTRK